MTKRQIFNCIKAISFALIIHILLFPIDLNYLDRANYLDYAQSSSVLLLGNLNFGIKRLIFNEPFWLIINATLNFFGTNELTVYIIIILSTTFLVYTLFERFEKNLLEVSLIIFFPMILLKEVIHIRQGLAIAFFLYGITKQSIRIKILFLIAAMFIHSTFIIISPLYLLTEKINFDRRSLLIYIIITISSSALFFFNLKDIMYFFDLRQASEYAFSSKNNSGLGLIFWFGFSIIFLLESTKTINKNIFELTILFFYLSGYFFFELTGRIFESAAILLLLKSLDDNFIRRNLIIPVIFIFMLLFYIPKLSQPYLGWINSN